MEHEEQSVDGLEKIQGVLRRRWRLAAVVFLLLFCSAFTVIWSLPDLYLSTATVLIERQQIPTDLVRSTVTSGLETRLQTISQEIFSRSRLESLIDRFNLYEEDASQQAIESLIQQMRRDIKLELKGSGQRANRTTVAFTLSYKGSDPEKVAVVTNTLASFYIEENLKVREELASATSQFFRLQLQQAEEELRQIEQQVSEFKRRHLGQLPHQQQSNLGTLDQLNTRLRYNNDKQMRVSELISSLERQLSEVSTPVTGGGPDATAVRIAELREMLRDLRKRYSDKYPDVVRVKAEIAALVERLGEQASPTASETAVPESPQVIELRKQIASSQRELNALRFEAEQIERAMTQYEARLDQAPLAEQEFQVLMRDYDTTTQLYRSLLLRQKEAELAESMEQRQKGEQFRIIDPALPSQVPAAPNRPMFWAVAALLCLGIAGGVALLLEQLDSSYHSAEELRTSSSIPLLVAIPQIVTRRDRRRRRWAVLLSTAGCILGLVVLVGASHWYAVGNERLSALLMR